MAQSTSHSNPGRGVFDVLEPIKQRTMAESVAQRLMGLLSNGTLSPGDKLPSERELAAHLHVGRATLREALKLLTMAGLLRARRGDGTYVREEFLPSVCLQIEWATLLSEVDVAKVLEVRQPLEVKAARLAAERATPQDIDKLGVFREVLEIDGRDIGLEVDIDLAFHQAIAAAAHNQLLSQLMDSLVEPVAHRMS